MPDDLKIVFPPKPRDKKEKPIPSSFVVLGWVSPEIEDKEGKKRKVKSIRARISHVMADGSVGTPLEVTARFVRPRALKDKKSLLWVASFHKVGCKDNTTRAKVTVNALPRDGSTAIASTSVDVVLKANNGETKGPPTIDWPDMDGYDITGDERSFFPVMGTSELPLTTVHIVDNEAFTSWDEESTVWWGVFFDLGTNPGTGNDREMIAANADGEAKRIVNILAS
jgi:hypothetical protein